MPTNFVACVPSIEFSEGFKDVYRQYEERLEAKEAAKRKPKSRKKGKENEDGEKPAKEKKVSKKKVAKNQPTITAFIQDKKVASDEDNISLERPKNVVFKKMISGDKDFNNKLISTKFVTPENMGPVKVAEKSDTFDQSDSFSYRPAPLKERREDILTNQGHGRLTNERMEDSCPFTDSMREYMDSGDDSGLSDIIDDILGVKKVKPRHKEVTNLVDSLCNMSISPSHGHSPDSPLGLHAPKHLAPGIAPRTPFGLLPKHLAQTSTPAEVRHFTFSPEAKKTHKTTKVKEISKQVKPSDVFDISDCSFMMDMDQSQATEKAEAEESEQETNKIDADKQEVEVDEMSFDQFELATQETPFAERVKRRMNH